MISKSKFISNAKSKQEFRSRGNWTCISKRGQLDVPDSAWVGDIAYIPTDEGWLELVELVGEMGDRWVERILSLKLTCRMHGIPSFPVLMDAISNLFKGQ
ncbi:hypothetical protein ACFL0Q_01820 [Thermodesulfobacteriota bacterium]